MGFTEATGDCRVLMKAAVRATAATESRALTRSDDATVANPDCRFPHPDSDGAAPQLAASAVGPSAAAQPGAPCAPTGAIAGPSGISTAAASPGATPANVARDGANGASPPPGVFSPFSTRAAGVPTAVSHGTSSGHMDAPSAGNASADIWGASGQGNGRPRFWSLRWDECRDCLIADRPHFGQGFCERCYQARYRHGNLPADEELPPARWSRHSLQCLYCGRADVEHHTRGYCRTCYPRSPVCRARKRGWKRRLHTEVGGAGDLFRLQSAARKKRSKDRLLGLEPTYSFIAYRVTWKIFEERCAACDAREDLTIDHHYAASTGTPITPDNAVLMCRACNSAKGDRSPRDFYSAERLRGIEKRLEMARILVPLIERSLPRCSPHRGPGKAA